MGSQLEAIKEILNPSLIDNGGILLERSKDSKGSLFEMKRKIVAHGIDYLLFKFDCSKNLFPFFNERSGLNKFCDYLLFAEEGQTLILLLIELKLGTESASKQLNASECFGNFILSTATRMGYPINHYQIKKVRISDLRAKKRNRHTKPKRLEFDINRTINYDYSDHFRIKEVLDVY